MGQLSVTSGAVLALFFGLAALIVFPRTILIVAAGASFGIGAAPIILVAGTAGGTLAFLLARYIASGWFRRKLEQRSKLEAIAEAVDKEGWRIVALMRLGAPVPSALQNYLFGLTRIHPMSFILATLVFSAPQVFLFTFLGATGRASLTRGQARRTHSCANLGDSCDHRPLFRGASKLLRLRGRSDGPNKGCHSIR